ncbi:SDR family oxidoreductase [Arthrobacter sulfonylureivorans]|uniref:SDR family oxidoreductase n=1 Tax=Arthrobacter sulfonylureivorans TaxID=2486855 RepID=A0ABY3WJF1_9MICC|nr:SDR family oxidoreductase [Arthrobacter sulfonylureivorans]UNK47779.1 SDR family oxidoreductase [Arthrobacter sulfonylureivorans]
MSDDISKDLSGRTFAVTGAASGIGLAVAERLHREGAEVVAIDRNTAAGPWTASITADFTDQAGFEHVAAQLPDRLDGLFNVAGVPGTAPVQTQLLVNVTAYRRMADVCVPRIDRGGFITNIASLAGSGWRNRAEGVVGFLDLDTDDQLAWIAEQGIEGAAAYPFTKECVIVLTQLMSVELIARGIRVNSISPGPVTTPILEDFRQTIGDTVIDEARAVVGRLATPVDIAAVAALMARPDIAWMNGIDIPVDGGLGAYRFARAAGKGEVNHGERAATFSGAERGFAG